MDSGLFTPNNDEQLMQEILKTPMAPRKAPRVTGTSVQASLDPASLESICLFEDSLDSRSGENQPGPETEKVKKSEAWFGRLRKWLRRFWP